MRRKSYLLTTRAVADLREARAWSRARWGKDLTDGYFEDLHGGAQYIAKNDDSLRDRRELAGGTALLLYPVREHCIVYEPLAPRLIAMVAAIRQSRDIPAILQKWAAPIRQELKQIRSKIKRGEFRVSSRSGPKSRRKK